MKISLFVKSFFVGIPVGITFLDCVGYIARVEGNFRKRLNNSFFLVHHQCFALVNKGISMQPALNPDVNTSDYVFLSRWAVKNLSVERGDIVALISPKDPDQKIIKRVVALQGDVVSTLGYKKPFVRVPEGHCWVEGDHTGNTSSNLQRIVIKVFILITIRQFIG